MHNKIGLDAAAIAKVVCFGANGLSAFHNCKNEVTTKTSVLIGTINGRVHCYRHKFNMVVQTLSELMIIHLIEELLRNRHNCFVQSPKKFA